MEKYWLYFLGRPSQHKGGEGERRGRGGGGGEWEGAVEEDSPPLHPLLLLRDHPPTLIKLHT